MDELAFQIILKSFKDKKDKAGEPYIGHLERVNKAVPDYGVWNEVKIIALLHDLLEDCPEWTEGSLRHLFTDNIVDAVVALTHKDGQSYHDYITQVMGNDWAAVVKRYDLEDNMNVTRLKELTENDFKRLQKYHKAYMRIMNEQK